MARIPRKTAKVFGVGGGAAPGGVGVFGSLGAGSPAYSIDPAVIQAAAAWAAGWGSAVVSDFPALEDLNSVPFVLSQQIAEILQDGIPPYDAGTTYFSGSFCQVSGVIYVSLVDNNTGNTPVSNPTDWSIFGNLPAVFQNELVPTALSGNTNDYNPTGWNSNIFNLILANSSVGSINLTGLKFQANGQIVNILGNNTQDIVLKNESGSSAAANRFNFPSGADITLTGNPGPLLKSVQLYYSSTLGWILLSKNF